MTSGTAVAEPVTRNVRGPSVGAPPSRAIPDLAVRRTRARVLGKELGGLIDDPDALTERLRGALTELADEPYRAGLHLVAPGLEAAFGVRSPLAAALVAGMTPAIRQARPAEALWVAELLSRTDELELRLMALPFLRRSLPDDPERTWQLVRRLSRRATEWISVDSLASVVAEGILREQYRWAEIEQLVYAASPWERRLVGSTIATMRFVAGRLLRRGVLARSLGAPEVGRGLAVIGSLIGDEDPNVRKALSWALRELAVVDRSQVTAFIERETATAVATNDGNRAWVVRDALVKVEPRTASDIRARLSGIRVRPHAASTSTASGIAGRFGRVPDPRAMREPPL